MKKVIVILATVLVAISATAQSWINGLAVGAGYTYELDKISPKDKDLQQLVGDNKLNFNGFYINADYTIAKLLGPVDLNFGIGYKLLGNTEKDEPLAGMTLRATTTFHNLSIPVRFRYSHDFGIFKAFVFAGPKAEVTLAGSVKEVTKSGKNTTTTIYDFFEGDGFGRFQLYLGAGLGAEFMDHFRATISYDGGLLNRNKGDNRKNYRYNTPAQLNVGVAYVF